MAFVDPPAHRHDDGRALVFFISASQRIDGIFARPVDGQEHGNRTAIQNRRPNRKDIDKRRQIDDDFIAIFYPNRSQIRRKSTRYRNALLPSPRQYAIPPDDSATIARPHARATALETRYRHRRKRLPRACQLAVESFEPFERCNRPRLYPWRRPRILTFFSLFHHGAQELLAASTMDVAQIPRFTYA